MIRGRPRRLTLCRGASPAIKIGLLVGILGLLSLTASAHGAAGDLDASFDGDGVANGTHGQTYAVAVQKDGKIVAAGCTEVCGTAGERGDFTLARFTAGGSLDPGFGSGGVATANLGESDQAHAIAIQPDGKIVAAGCTGCDWFTGGTSAFALARYNADGTLDTTFGSGGKVKSDLLLGLGLSRDVAYGVVVQPDGKIVAGGFSGGDFAVARYNQDGSPDRGFGFVGISKTSFGGHDLGFALALQEDGKIVLAGDAEDAGGQGDAAVARYLTNGNPDASFSGDGKATLDFNASYRAVQGLALQQDGKVVVAGATHRIDQDFALGRFTAAGDADQSFGTAGKVVTDFGGDGLGRGDVAEGVAVQSNGKIVAAGYTSGGAGSGYTGEQVGLSRYNSDGSLDSSFGSGGKLISILGRPHDVALQGDGKILVTRGPGPFGLIRYLGS